MVWVEKYGAGAETDYLDFQHLSTCRHNHSRDGVDRSALEKVLGALLRAYMRYLEFQNILHVNTLVLSSTDTKWRMKKNKHAVEVRRHCRKTVSEHGR